MSIEKNLEQVQYRIAKACEKSFRKVSEVTLVGVTKMKPSSMIREALSLGLFDFGENYVQEWKQKNEDLKDLKIRWHFIGALQRNKVKFLAGKVDWIHSVDKVELAAAINQAAQLQGVQQNVLLEVNIANEATKSGASVDDALQILAELTTLKGLRVGGLMALPPVSDSEVVARQHFETLRRMRDELARQTGRALPHLSMGTSGDFEAAILEGATMVRVGTSIFGER